MTTSPTDLASPGAGRDLGRGVTAGVTVLSVQSRRVVRLRLGVQRRAAVARAADVTGRRGGGAACGAGRERAAAAAGDRWRQRRKLGAGSRGAAAHQVRGIGELAARAVAACVWERVKVLSSCLK